MEITIYIYSDYNIIVIIILLNYEKEVNLAVSTT